ncbi:MAG: hypothetical protein AAF530_23370 [Pseudomonadota bacterium]
MRSRIQSIISDFEGANRPLVARTQCLLDRICTDRSCHARFMNTLSLLEHMGSHKIMVTQSGGAIDQSTLKHLAEEARHAFFFKRQAERLSGLVAAFEAEQMLAPAAARMYFQRLEAATKKSLLKDQGPEPHPQAIYLYMSMIVEFRAVWGYRLYQEALTKAKIKMSLKSLLAEETGHLTDMAERISEIGYFSDQTVAAFCAEESRLFERFLTSLEKAMAGLTAVDDAQVPEKRLKKDGYPAHAAE